ncbi:hypothetical protein CFIICLFH_3043 [Methylobacterium goesingense]|uniref:Transposase InsO family protein n=1 Tax=Methylobacterium goesingense TaxID=243690 RepID=A0ABV2LBX7_9HYPH|nr:hypothetical protein CFIICLFH_3043 [Methylobacterium goesingense]
MRCASMASPTTSAVTTSYVARKDDCLSQEIFYSLKETQTLIGIWQSTYNRVRQHSLLGHRPPAPVTAPELASG